MTCSSIFTPNTKFIKTRSLLAERISQMFDRVMGTDSDDLSLWLYPELLFKVSKVQLIDRLGSEPNIVGTIHVTTSHIIFKADDTAKEIWIPNGLIGTVERGPLSVAGCPLSVRCKHFLVLNFLISRDKECQDLFETLSKCGRPMNISEVFAFESRERNSAEKKVKNGPLKGWDRFKWEAEFARQGVIESQHSWRYTDFNKDYKHCDTYPEQLWVPNGATTQMLIGSCKFRSRARLPVLTYWYRPNGASITRCAQPLTGFSARCVEDEQLMNLIANTNSSSEPLYLIDTRPVVNAMVNKMQGKGFEDVRNYANMRFHSFDIENIHVMRSSQQKFLDACQKSQSLTDYYKQLESSGWLRHIRSLVECGVFIAESLVHGISCVVHCSDGWDRTAQTISIAQLLLDPYYRTIRGFQILIEKDWLGFGHKFDDRCGHVAAIDEDAAKEVSPIFTQFLDVVYQLMRQRPRDFEFNERYLIEINENAYSCQYGTFLGNCDKDRKDLKLSRRTRSLWSAFDEMHDDYLNPFYEPNRASYLDSIDLHPSCFVVWIAMYNRFDTGILPRESVIDVTIATLEHIGVLEAQLASLHTKIAEAKSCLGNEKTRSSDSPSTMVDSGHSSSDSAQSPSVASCVSAVPKTSSQPGSMSAECSSTSSKNGKYAGESSGICNSSSTSGDSSVSFPAIWWQSLRTADECSSKCCGAEFETRLERRLHCYRCGKLHCRRCIMLTNDQKGRICVSCAAIENEN